MASVRPPGQKRPPCINGPLIEVRLLILDTKDCQDSRLVDFIVHLVLARMIRRFSIARVGHVFTFRVAFLLLRMEFMHSSFSQTGSRFFWSRFAFGDILLAYWDVSEMLDGIFQIVRIILTQIWKSFWRKGGQQTCTVNRLAPWQSVIHHWTDHRQLIALAPAGIDR